MTVKHDELVLVIDFGAQYSQLIARRVRECGVYSEIIPYHASLAEIAAKKPKGIIFSGGPNSVYGEKAPHSDPGIYSLGVPVLGICYGMQLMALQLGGEVARSEAREYGHADLNHDVEAALFKGIAAPTPVWMSHGDSIVKPPAGFVVSANTSNTPTAAMSNVAQKLYGVQFHPEVVHTREGTPLLKNFLFNICGCRGDWNMGSFIDMAVAKIREQVGDKKVLCGLSGGVDSSVAAVLVHRAVGDQLTCVFVDHGFMRKDEAKQVVHTFRDEFHINLVHVDASERFMNRVTGVTEPESKRKIIGEEFIRVFESEAEKIGASDFLVQGTLYPDVIESGTSTAAVIKSHHNVGGLPEDMKFALVEPLRELFKDEVRVLGAELGLSEEIVQRQPFPGPGLAIRIIGEITEDRLNILREADAIVREEIRNAGLHRKIWQSFAVLPAIKSVGVMGDERTYAYTIGIRAVESEDGMTADWSRMPYEVLDKMSRRIVNEVKGVNRIVYDVTSKPPSTIEWE
jgi:GMP synthase (glutamine-hydrolysing)